MRFTTGLAVGIALGWAIASRMQRQEVELEARREARGILGAMTRHPSTQRLGRWARANLQRRLEPGVDDLSMN